jgi:teichuronic acid biosynthesis glycosyltransferase TuaH
MPEVRRSGAGVQRRLRRPAARGGEVVIVEMQETRPRFPAELVVCSLEPWDEVWRRNQFLVRELLTMEVRLRVLFVEPPSDVGLAALRRQPLRGPSLRRAGERLWLLRPLKLLPRLLGPYADDSLVRQVRRAAGRLSLDRPVLWVNDSDFAPLLGKVDWPVVYDVTDDWLAASLTVRRLERRRQSEERLLREAAQVVVCSPDLVATRGESRDVVLIPNAIDAEHFRTPRPRPSDMPSAPVALYVGSLHEDRLDVDLCVETAERLRHVSLVFVGPSALSAASIGRLSAQSNVHLLGSRPYDIVPAYLQHADVVVVPHVVSPFTESLDPIKAYECLAVATPTVATPVAGFRELAGRLGVVPREAFPDAVRAAVDRGAPVAPAHDLPSWRTRAEQFADVLCNAASDGWSSRGQGGVR